jgi:coenzyme F420-reducing hydrogenase beta subunit
MPEKGWKAVSLREATHKRLMDRAKAQGLTVNDVISKMLTVNQLTVKPTSRRPKTRQKRQGVQADKETEELEKVIEAEIERRGKR